MKYLILTAVLAALLECSAASAQSVNSTDRVQAYLTSGQAASAVRYSLEWTKAEPNNDAAWASLGTAYYDGLHRSERAIPAFQYAVAINPYSPQHYAALGEAYLTEKKFQAAAEAFEHAAELAPLKSVYWNHLASAYMGFGQRDQALGALKKNEVVAAPHGTWIDWYNLGTAYDKLQTYEKAVTAYNRALELNPRSATVWTRLGSAEQALGRWGSAAEHFKLGMALGDNHGAQKYAGLQTAG